jgi:ABC-type multidrug transport system fused ATPase/permease subunit
VKLDRALRAPSTAHLKTLFRDTVGPTRPARLLWIAAAGSLLVGLVTWAVGAGYVALWCFGISAVAVALVLPLPYAVISPLFMGVIGWLVDMLPFVILAGWAAVVIRWAVGLLRARRVPRGGKWVLLPIGLMAWTTFGVFSVPTLEFRHFLLLFGVQAVTSGVLLAVVDCLSSFEDRLKVVASLVGFVLVLSVGVLLQFVGIPIQALQNEEVGARIEGAYGLDAFPNNLEMIKYGLSSKAGAREFRNKMVAFSKDKPALPEFEVFLPRFRAFENHIVVRFAGSARPMEDSLAKVKVGLIYDNVGLTPANTVPRMRSFARNSLTYAGVCVAMLPLCFYFVWRGDRRRRLLGRAGVAACLFGAGFSLVRGAWVAILIGLAYLVVDGLIGWRQKTEVVIAFLMGALVLTGFFLARYEVDPLSARALGKGSVATRADVYQDTVDSLSGLPIIFGFGTERPRTESGVSHVAGRYIPDAGTHSTFLNYLFRTGVPGALGIIALYALALLHARAASRVRQGDERIFASLLTASLVMAAAHAVILNLFTEPIYTLTVSLLLAVAMAGALQLGSSVLPWRTRAADR